RAYVGNWRRAWPRSDVARGTCVRAHRQAPTRWIATHQQPRRANPTLDTTRRKASYGLAPGPVRAGSELPMEIDRLLAGAGVNVAGRAVIPCVRAIAARGCRASDDDESRSSGHHESPTRGRPRPEAGQRRVLATSGPHCGRRPGEAQLAG